MHEFPGYVFLDPPKTGTTFVSEVLERHDNEVHFHKHKPARRDAILTGKFMFSTIRHPFDFYRSTYAYGIRKDGGGRKALYARHGEERIAQLFDHTDAGFNEWLELFLDLQEEGFEQFVPTTGWDNVGRLTYRFFKLALRDTKRFTPSHDAILAEAPRWLPSAYLRTSHLRGDLEALTRHLLYRHMQNPAGAVAHCRRMKARNVSPHPAYTYTPRNKTRVQDRERAMFELWASLHVEPKTGIVRSSLQGHKP